MIGVNRVLYQDSETKILVEINDANVLTVLDENKVPLYILELKASRKD